MAQMNRNLNLEEIDSDALFGIDALKKQSVWQKIMFWGSVIGGVLLNVLLPLYVGTSTILCIFLFLGLLLIGVSVGCNYTEDMTYGKYVYSLFFKSAKSLFYESTEDVEQIRAKSQQLRKEEELLLRSQSQSNPREQRKLLIKVVAFVVGLAIVVGGIWIYSKILEENHIHHQVEIITEEVDE